MAKGSQLAQLKSALSDAGLSHNSKSKSTGKKRKRSSAPIPDKAAKKLREIHERLNPFDVKVTNLKHDVGGRKLKGVTGRPGLSKQAGIEQRKKTLLVEYEQKNHSGGIVDRRFGENDPTMPPEERMLERFTKERQRASKGVAFNLEDGDELTHYGKSLSALDDFDNAELNIDENDEDTGQIDSQTVERNHFGGFEENIDNEKQARKKSKAEIMSEVIAKSKEHKYQRQMEREEDEDARARLDQEFDSIRGLLLDGMGTSSAGANSIPLGRAPNTSIQEKPVLEQDDQEYDQFVRELAFDKRSKPKDRTKTEDELALEEKEALEAAERARVRRMMGVRDDSEDEEDGRKSQKRKRKRERGADDLDDDFVDDDEMLAGIGTGLVSEHEQKEEDGSEEISSDYYEKDPAEPLDEDHKHGEDDGELDLGNRAYGISDGPTLLPSRRSSKNGNESVKKTILPFTFPCPASHDEFLTIIENLDDGDIPTVVQRIRALYHPSLSKDNPAKLQGFVGVLVDHILYIASSPTPIISLIEALSPHIYALTQRYPVTSAQVFVEKLSLMYKNLMRGLSKGATSPDAKTWPGLAELSFLRILGVIWSTSDMNHAVISPARVLMGAYLGLGRIRSAIDLVSGLFLCTLFLQYEELSKRLVPEAINFLLNALLHIGPNILDDSESVPGSFPLPDFRNSVLSTPLNVSGTAAKVKRTRPDLIYMLCRPDSHHVQCSQTLLATTLELLGKFAKIYKGLDGFVELYTPVLEILRTVTLDRCPVELQDLKSKLQGEVSRLLRFARLSRHPLQLQAHKPIPIPSYVPKFNASSSNLSRNQDPDRERASASKLRNQVKQERKGAIRELRKDSRFLATVQQKRQMEEAQGYNARMKKVFSSIEGERAEQKALGREKAREKKRAGRK